MIPRSNHAIAALQAECSALELRLLQAQHARTHAGHLNQVKSISAQILQLERQIHGLEQRKLGLKQEPASTPLSGSGPGTPTPLSKDEHLPIMSNPSATARLLDSILQQNELLRQIVLSEKWQKPTTTQIGSRSTTPRASLPGALNQGGDDYDKVDDEKAIAADRTQRVGCSTGTASRASSASSVPSTPSTRNHSRRYSSVLVPDVLWTDEDEQALLTLEDGAVDDATLDKELEELIQQAESPTATSPDAIAHNGTDDEQDAEAIRERHRQERNEGRKRMADLLNASMSKARGGMQRPRWRIELEREYDEVSSFQNEDSSSLMSPLQIWRSVAYAVLAVKHLEKVHLDKKIEAKVKAEKDFEAMLSEYFEVTREWLTRIVRAPLVSVLQDGTLDMDLGGDGIFDGPKGPLKLLTAVMGRKPPLDEVAADADRLLKLKVRVKAILDLVVRAIAKHEIPVGLLEFWRRMASDGVYFPASYQLFSLERQVFEFDSLGATRHMDENGYLPVSTSMLFAVNAGQQPETDRVFSRFNVMFVNFILVRVLIAHIVSRPWLAGIGSANLSKRARANLRSMATLLYLICGQLSPLPPLLKPQRGARRARRTSAPSSTSGEQTATTVISAEIPSESSTETPISSSFMPVETIVGELAVRFPANNSQVTAFILEQQVRDYAQKPAVTQDLTSFLCATEKEKVAGALHELQLQLFPSESPS